VLRINVPNAGGCGFAATEAGIPDKPKKGGQGKFQFFAWGKKKGNPKNPTQKGKKDCWGMTKKPAVLGKEAPTPPEIQPGTMKQSGEIGFNSLTQKRG